MNDKKEIAKLNLALTYAIEILDEYTKSCPFDSGFITGEKCEDECANDITQDCWRKYFLSMAESKSKDRRQYKKP